MSRINNLEVDKKFINYKIVNYFKIKYRISESKLLNCFICKLFSLFHCKLFKAINNKYGLNF